MASYGHPMSLASRPGQQQQQPVYGAASSVPQHAPSAPAGTFAPGTKIQVGNHRVVIQKYLSEGGFAHVYLVKMPTPIDGTDLAVLKRVAVPDKDALRGMRTEVETMKRLKGHRPIVTYIDSHASELRGGQGYEVFLLMEYCNGGGLIDFMNTRLQHRLTEPEILKIFADVAEGVACMHYLKPPLLHRDLKVENVLITTQGGPSGPKRFKLCDFGSAAPPKPAPNTVVECRLMDEDVQKHTTLQYRSPEMIDVYRKQPIDEKSDIWALGVLLYKLCYYTTPFEDQGQLAILNASYRFPSHPQFSDRLKKLIASMLKEDRQSRPTIYQVLREACLMQGREVPIHDIYSERSQSEPRQSNDRVPATEKKMQSTPAVGAVFSPPVPQEQVIPEIVPMRRGRPPAASQAPPQQPAKPNPSPMRVTNGDPFAALDTKFAGKKDELSSRFPTLDQFSLLHDQGTKFDFDAPTSPPAPPTKDLGQRVAERLADEAFSIPQASPPKASPPKSNEAPRPKTVVPATKVTPITSPPTGGPALSKVPSAPAKPAEMSRAQAIISSNPDLQAISSQPSSKYVSTGTMTTTLPLAEKPPNPVPIYRFPPADQSRASSLPRQPDGSSSSTRWQRPEDAQGGSIPRVPSFQSHNRHPSSSRPSLEGGRPNADLLDPQNQQRPSGARPRPASTHLDSNLDYLRGRDQLAEPARSGGLPSPKLPGKAPSPRIEPEDETVIESNVDFLRSMEESDPKKKEKRHSHGKRSSLTSLSGTKHMLAGKFGDAFKKFEHNPSHPPGPRTPSPLRDLDRRDLTPIAGSEATDGRSDDGQVLEETDDMTPEQRREIERRRLSMEEKRVAAAQAEYRQRVADRAPTGPTGPTPLPKSIGGVSRAVSIQNRVNSLLNEDQRSQSSVKRQAEGYGKYSDAATAASRVDKQLPEIPRKPVGGGLSKPLPPSIPGPSQGVGSASSSAVRPIPMAAKPVAPRKPMHLNNLPTGGRASSPPKRAIAPAQQQASDRLMAADLPGQPVLEMSAKDRDDYLQDFAKRFPSLNSIEMVERDLEREKGGK